MSSKVTVLRSGLEKTGTKSAWKWAFADALIRLCPDLNPDAADEFADSELIDSGFLDAELAAQRCAARLNGEPLPPSSEAQSGSG